MLRKYLIAGLLIWLPLATTLWVLDFIVTTMDRTLMVLPASMHPDQVLGIHIPGLGLVRSVIILPVTGAHAANMIGARMFSWWESVLVKIPIVRPICSSVKQLWPAWKPGRKKTAIPWRATTTRFTWATRCAPPSKLKTILRHPVTRQAGA